MNPFSQALELLPTRSLTANETALAIGWIMDGHAAEWEIAALLTGLAVRGETEPELTGAALAMRQRATRIPTTRSGLLDTCGTGGDRLRTFNISTAAALTAAAAGVPVAKHGNRKATSTTGSADVLEQLGVRVELTPSEVARCLEELGVGFCFARVLHGAMKHVAPIRGKLPFRTIFNLLGPLTNPAGAAFQVIGTHRQDTAQLLAQTVHQLGTQRTLVVCGNGELDEVALWGETTVLDVQPHGIQQETWTARSLGLPTVRVEDLQVDTAAESAEILRRVFRGEECPARQMVLANTAAALYAAGRVLTPVEGVDLAKQTLDSGAVTILLNRLVSQTAKVDHMV